MNLLIIDDEYRSRMGLSNQVESLFPKTFSIAEATGVKDGLEKIKEFSPSIVLLDIHMDDGSGFDLLDALAVRSFQLIFTTAYDEHAIQAFEEDAISYLLKPVSPSKLSVVLKKAIEKVKHEASLKVLEEIAYPSTNLYRNRIKIPISNGVRFLNRDEIIFVKAEGNYFRIYLQSEEKSLLVSKTLRYFESQMDTKSFMRVHKSYVVNMNKIQEYSRSGGGTITLDKKYEVPVSPMYKEAFMEKVSIKT
jgi:two-component system LytT family response regulator